MNGYDLVFYADWIIQMGFSPYQIRIDEVGDTIAMNGESLWEYLPGVFFAESGEALDFRSGDLLFRGIRMDRID
jgi:hypothetical protein